MAPHRQSEAAKFSQHHGAVRLGFRHCRSGITVNIMHIADVAIRPAAGAVHQPGGIVGLDSFGDAFGLELPPAFIERHPHDDARMIPSPIDKALEFALELLAGFLRAFVVRVSGANETISARHVLPNQQPEFVAPIIPAVRFNLDVLAGHVESKLPGHFDVVTERLIRRRGVNAVGPKTLIQRSELEERLVIQQEAKRAFVVLGSRDFAHPEIGGDLVHSLAALHHRELKIVEVRRLWRPEFRIGNRNLKRLPRAASGPAHLFVTVQRDCLDGEVFCICCDTGGHLERAGINIRNEFKLLKSSLGDRLQPRRLPNAGGRRVPDAAWFVDLFAAWLRAGVRWIPDGDDQFLFTGRFEHLRDIEGEVVVAAAMGAELDAVDIDRGFPIRRAEMEQDLFVSPAFRHFKRAPIPEPVGFPDLFHHSRQR